MRPTSLRFRSSTSRRRPYAAGALLAGASLVGGLVAFAPGASADLADGLPFGGYDEASATGDGVHVRGWAIDPDSGGATDVHVYIDGAAIAAMTADHPRYDVGAAFPAYGSNHGFDTTIPTGRGTHDVCVYAINGGAPGPNVGFGCRTVTVGRLPFGSVDQTVPSPGGVTVSGWMQDPDTPAPIGLHAYVDGALVAVAQADAERPDVAAAYGNGSAHGFNMAVPVPVGTHQVCVYGIDATGDSNALLNCRSVTLTGRPFGVIEGVELAGANLRVTGWAIDPDTTAPTRVRVSVNEQVTEVDAVQTRPDVAGFRPAYGADHGFVVLAPIPPSAAAGATLCLDVANVTGTPGEDLHSCTPFTPPPAR
jgi:hypothetical protein